MIEVPCPLCSSQQWKKRWEAADWLAPPEASRLFNLVECLSCRLVYVNPQPDPAELECLYPPGFWWTPSRPSDGALTRTLRKVEELYRKAVIVDHVYTLWRALGRRRRRGGPLRLLDVGCGSGSFVAACAEQGMQVVGMDRSPEPLRVVRHAAKLPAVAALPDHPPFRPASFDVVTLFNVLEHLPHPLSVLRRLRTLLRPGGLLLVQVPNLEAVDFALFGTRWRSIEPPRHLLYFTAETLRAMLERAGYEVLGVRRFSLRDNPASLATSAAPGWDPIVLRARGEAPEARLVKEGLYFLLILLFLPLAWLDSLQGGGSTLLLSAAPEDSLAGGHCR